MIFKGLQESPALLGASLHTDEIEMRRGRPAARIDLDAGDAHAGGLLENVLEAHAAEAVGYESKFHLLHLLKNRTPGARGSRWA